MKLRTGLNSWTILLYFEMYYVCFLSINHRYIKHLNRDLKKPRIYMTSYTYLEVYLPEIEIRFGVDSTRVVRTKMIIRVKVINWVKRVKSSGQILRVNLNMEISKTKRATEGERAGIVFEARGERNLF